MTQLQKARALAAAFRRLDRARVEMEAAGLLVGTLVGQVCAGRSVDRATVREALAICGLLEEKAT